MRYLKILAIKLLTFFRIADIKLRFDNRDIILLYHSIETEPSGYPHSVSKENFYAHIEILTNYFKFVSLDELFSRSSNSPRVALTFDDAYDDFYTVVFPILLKEQIPATVFVPTSFIETNQDLYKDDDTGYHKRHLSWKQMQELRLSKLVEFESHAHSHFDSVRNIQYLRDDVLISIKIIEKELGRQPKYFAYPFGDCNKFTHKILLDCGFSKLFTTQSTHVKNGEIQGRYDIDRKNERINLFKLMISGIKS